MTQILISALVPLLPVIEALAPIPLKRSITQPTSSLQKRDGTFEVALYDYEVNYLLPLEIESQEVWVKLDTGSSDLWIMSSSNPYCDSGVMGDYAMDCSYSTLEMMNSSIEMTTDVLVAQYADYSVAMGLFGYADVTLLTEDAVLEDFYLAVAFVTNSSTPILGIGLVGNEMNTDGRYSNFPYALKESGAIDKVMYSIYMDDEADSGAVLFGDIDHAKYDGELQTYPVLKESDLVTNAFLIAVDEIAMSDGDETLASTDSEIYAVIDTGTATGTLPQEVIDYVLEVLYDGAEVEPLQYYDVYCSNATELFNTNVTYTLGELIVTVPCWNWALDFGDGVCRIYLPAPQGENSTLYYFGDVFLKQVYTVFDLEDQLVQMASFKSTNDTDIEMLSGDEQEETTYATSLSATTSPTMEASTQSGSSSVEENSADESGAVLSHWVIGSLFTFLLL